MLGSHLGRNHRRLHLEGSREVGAQQNVAAGICEEEREPTGEGGEARSAGEGGEGDV